MAGSVERVRQHLLAINVQVDFREFDVSTKNSAMAAKALGCSVAEIAKSVVFRENGALVVVISGDMRVDPQRLVALTGNEVVVATPEEVRSMTGYPIGGVPPFPHGEGVKVLVEESVERFEHVWAAGGAPSVVFRILTEDLIGAAGGNTVDVSEQS
jgi:prolyl-tRNA editing enzyme YbaK/EbsC (Cys-tRNA(Pro) deacylase)